MLICNGGGDWVLSLQVGNAFVQQYYQILHQLPDLVYRFYQDASRLGRPPADRYGDMVSVTTMEVSPRRLQIWRRREAEASISDDFFKIFWLGW